jgi:hypothetical protein
MSTRARRTLWLTGIAVCLLFIVGPELRASWAAKNKYRIGTTAKAIERASGTRLSPDPRQSLNIPPSTTDAEVRRRAFAYSVWVWRDFVHVSFNSEGEVLRVEKVTPIQLLSRWIQ